MPLGAEYEFMANAKGFVSDGYILEVQDFNSIVKYNQHEDLNVSVGIRNVDKGWSIWAFGRNLLEARPTYFGQFDTFPNGLQSVHLSPASFTTFGIRFEYLIQ